MKINQYVLLIFVMALFAAAYVSRTSMAQETELACETDVIVQEGDWLSTIAEAAYGDATLYQAIALATNLKAISDTTYATIDANDAIEPGWKLCIPSQLEAEALEFVTPEDPSVLTVDELANATYSGIYTQPITLTNGVYEGEPFTPDSASRPTVNLISNGYIFGDIDGDGVEDAAVLLAENSGGSGTFTYVSAQLNQDGQPVDAGAVWVGDRTQIKSGTIENNQILLEIVTQGPDDAACCASLKVGKTYAIQDGLLAEVGSEDVGRISADDLNGTSWNLIELNFDEPVESDPAITIEFQDGQFSGSGGCNTYNSSFTLDEVNPSSMTLSPVISTRLACPEPILSQETAYFAALDSVNQWGYEVGQLALYYQVENGIGRLLYATPPVTETEPLTTTETVTGTQPVTISQVEMLSASPWQWIRFTDPLTQFEVASPESYTVTFLPDGTMQMVADCNNATASYTATEDGSITVTPGVSTLALCPPESLSEAFIQNLGFAAIYFFQDGNLLIDLMADGGTMTFSPQAVAAEAMVDDGATATITATEVITYVPAEVPGETQSGSCFANAIGLGRADAWRCTVGNAIHDPCFAVEGSENLVCEANPATGATGFALALTEPLPAPDPGNLKQAWLVELADGQVCGLMTGTVVGVGDRIAPYGCPDGTYLFEDFQQGEVWMAEKAVIGLNDNGFFTESSEMVALSRIWY